MPTNCIQDPQHECFGLAVAEILKHQMETMKEQLEQDRKDRKRDSKNNKKDHKQFFRRMGFAETSQALTQNQRKIRQSQNFEKSPQRLGKSALNKL